MTGKGLSINFVNVHVCICLRLVYWLYVPYTYIACIRLPIVLVQILYNRSLVQLGMCAFRHGMIKDAHDALMDVQSSGRSKELLAQVISASWCGWDY